MNREIPGVLWAGHLYDHTGYATGNRNILFRIARHATVRLDATHKEQCWIDPETCQKLESLKNVGVSEKAPFIRFFGPDYSPQSGRYRIVWTMMETYKIHPNMVELINKNFDELWTPTEWNRQVFVDSGVTVKTQSMPLGVDSAIYAPSLRKPLPVCRLLSTDLAGMKAIPQGYIVLSVGLPSARKGFDVIADAIARAFGNAKDVSLVLNVSWSPQAWRDKMYPIFAKYKFPVWSLEGDFSAQEMAAIYASSDLYVAASRGEGWNLPGCEAAACGLPVIFPDNTCHREVFGEDAWYFETEGVGLVPACNVISPWYNGMPFSLFGEKSVESLAATMKAVRDSGAKARARVDRLRYRITSLWTWDRAAAMVLDEIRRHQ